MTAAPFYQINEWNLKTFELATSYTSVIICTWCSSFLRQHWWFLKIQDSPPCCFDPHSDAQRNSHCGFLELYAILIQTSSFSKMFHPRNLCLPFDCWEIQWDEIRVSFIIINPAFTVHTKSFFIDSAEMSQSGFLFRRFLHSLDLIPFLTIFSIFAFPIPSIRSSTC